MSTWRELISEEFESSNDTWEDVVACTLSETELDVEFYGDYGELNGKPFTLWTKKRVYFPITYVGLGHVRSAVRDPDGKPTMHI